MPTIIENMQNKFEVDEKIYDIINKAVDTSLKLEGFDTPSEISITLVDNERIKEINSEYRQIDKATDVLSFPLVDMVDGEIQSDDGDVNLDENLLLLGDIIISLEKTKSQSEEYGHSFQRELAFLVTHGMFHLLGYDHMDEDQEKIMIGKQEAVLNEMGLAR